MPLTDLDADYSGGRGLPTDHLFWSAAGYAQLVVDSRGSALPTAAMPDVPFLCHFRHAAAICGDGPYQEIAKYLRRHSRRRVEPAFATPDHFDGVHFARRATAPTLFSVGLRDPVCPPSTVYAAFNQYAGEDRSMTVWPFGDHGGGCGSNPPVQPAWLRERGPAPEL
ncbi:acetylxylan esterase [Streptomyces sp. NPDC127110]|uniref:acetylxylan esterase n=1 Tax=Streptomyces sp. NPDC127110 TaxID=3345362 RepID=UPI0036278AE2